MTISFKDDRIVFNPGDIRDDFRPLRQHTGRETFILGVFNPGVTRLADGTILCMVRVAEALREAVDGDWILTPRMDTGKQRFVIDRYPAESVDFSDPRHLEMNQENGTKAMRLTSISWLLPVELNPAGEIVHVHYDRVLLPRFDYQAFGVEDARITRIDSTYYMTVVGVGFNKICTCLYVSDNGLDYEPKGVIFEHHNKDVVLFPEAVGDRYYALTRPEGSDIHLSFLPNSPLLAGKSISAAESPDLLHWKPVDRTVLPMRKNSLYNRKIGPGAPPVPIFLDGKRYFLELFHGVEHREDDPVGIYRTFSALFESEHPWQVAHICDEAFIEYNRDLKKCITGPVFLEQDVVFTTGIVQDADRYLVFSGELDTSVRMTTISGDALDSFLRDSFTS